MKLKKKTSSIDHHNIVFKVKVNHSYKHSIVGGLSLYYDMKNDGFFWCVEALW